MMTNEEESHEVGSRKKRRLKRLEDCMRLERSGTAKKVVEDKTGLAKRYVLVSTLLFSWTGRVLSHQNSLTHRFPPISTEELVLPRHARCVLSRLRCNEHSLLLGSYLSRIGRIENPSCSACGHSSQDTSHLILHCPATDSLRRSLFGDSLSLYGLWGVARLLELHGFPPCPHPSEGVCFVLFYLPFLSSIHEKANCIAILGTGSPHSLGSCLFRGLWATCLPHKGGASR